MQTYNTNDIVSMAKFLNNKNICLVHIDADFARYLIDNPTETIVYDTITYDRLSLKQFTYIAKHYGWKRGKND